MYLIIVYCVLKISTTHKISFNKVSCSAVEHINSRFRFDALLTSQSQKILKWLKLINNIS